MILADTDVLIDFLAGAQPVKNQTADYIQGEKLQTSVISCFELLSGAGENKRGHAVRQLLDSLIVLPLDRLAAAKAADVRQKLDRAGLAIGMGDSLIAGIALAHGMPLFTRNRKHFERVEGLKIVTIGENAP